MVGGGLSLLVAICRQAGQWTANSHWMMLVLLGVCIYPSTTNSRWSLGCPPAAATPLSLFIAFQCMPVPAVLTLGFCLSVHIVEKWVQGHWVRCSTWGVQAFFQVAGNSVEYQNLCTRMKIWCPKAPETPRELPERVRQDNEYRQFSVPVSMLAFYNTSEIGDETKRNH